MVAKYLADLFGRKEVDIDMIVIKFSVYNQRLRRITSGIIPSNAYGKLKFEFDFRTDDWNVVETKTANFYYKGKNYRVELDENNQCYVPKQVINIPSFSVAVHGGDIVTNNVKVLIEEVKSSSPIIPDGDLGEDDFGILDGGEIIPDSVQGPTDGDEQDSDDNNSAVSGVIFIPSIDEDKILSWTISKTADNLTIPDPVDLNPFDEWSTDGDVVSEYEWEEE